MGTKTIQELLGATGEAHTVVCDHCPELVETIFPIALCPSCYAVHRSKLHARADRELEQANGFWAERLKKPKEDPTADRDFTLAIRRLAPGVGTGRSHSPSSMEWEFTQLLRSWKQTGPQKVRKSGRAP